MARVNTGALAIINGFIEGLNKGLEKRRENQMEMAKLKILAGETPLKREEMALREKEFGLKEKEVGLKHREREGEALRNVTAERRKKEIGDYVDLQKTLPDTEEALANIDDAWKTFMEYSKTGIGGTGPLATGYIPRVDILGLQLGGGSIKKFTDEDLQDLDAKFKNVAIQNLVTKFKGMSKAMDSNEERKAFNDSQASIDKDDLANANILQTGKKLILTHQAEVHAQKAWVKEHGHLDDYKSPVPKLTAVIDRSGEMLLVPKDELKFAKKNGYMTIPEYAKFAVKEAPPVREELVNSFAKVLEGRASGKNKGVAVNPTRVDETQTDDDDYGIAKRLSPDDSLLSDELTKATTRNRRKKSGGIQARVSEDEF